jgi:hypothetical protein
MSAADALRKAVAEQRGRRTLDRLGTRLEAQRRRVQAANLAEEHYTALLAEQERLQREVETLRAPWRLLERALMGGGGVPELELAPVAGREEVALLRVQPRTPRARNYAPSQRVADGERGLGPAPAAPPPPSLTPPTPTAVPRREHPRAAVPRARRGRGRAPEPRDRVKRDRTAAEEGELGDLPDQLAKRRGR